MPASLSYRSTQLPAATKAREYFRSCELPATARGTCQILISAKGHGESSKGGGASFDKGGFGVGTNSEEWRTSGLGEAQERATTDLVAQIVAKKDRIE